MEVYLATGNKHKVEEIHAILAPFGITVKQAPDCVKIEPKEWDIETVASRNAQRLAEASGKITIVDDSGCFFAAYPGFPGPLSNWTYQRIGYDGFARLLEGKDTTATFRCAAAVCFPGKEPQTFVGEMHGSVNLEPVDLDKDTFPYERIFVIDGFDHVVSRIPKNEKNAHSHRGHAFRKLGAWLQEQQE